MFLLLVDGSRVPIGITSGWDQESQAGVLSCFPVLMENIPNHRFVYKTEKFTARERRSHVPQPASTRRLTTRQGARSPCRPRRLFFSSSGTLLGLPASPRRRFRHRRAGVVKTNSSF